MEKILGDEGEDCHVVDLNLKLELLSYRLPGVENFSLAVMTLLLCH